MLRRWLGGKSGGGLPRTKRLVPASSSVDDNSRLGAQLFGEEEWKKQCSQATAEGEFQFHNRRGRLPSMETKLVERFGPPLQAKHEFLFGHHPVELALRFTDKKVLASTCKLYIQDGSHEQRESSVIKQLAREYKVSYEITSKMRLDEVCKGEAHQGVVLDIPKQEYSFLDSEQALDHHDDSTKQQRKVILCLDEFQDPKTMGAVLRSALFFNVFAVIVSAKNSSQLDPLLCKASAGASLVLNEQRRMFATHNLVRTLHLQRRKGWKIIAPSSSSGGSKKQQSQQPLDAVVAGDNDKVVLVCSDRDNGELRSLVADQCEFVNGVDHIAPFVLPECKRDFPHLQANSIPLSVSNLTAAMLARLSL